MRVDNHQVYRRECNNDAALSARDRDCGMYMDVLLPSFSLHFRTSYTFSGGLVRPESSCL